MDLVLILISQQYGTLSLVLIQFLKKIIWVSMSILEIKFGFGEPNLKPLINYQLTFGSKTISFSNLFSKIQVPILELGLILFIYI
jgi:hypothetical protein